MEEHFAALKIPDSSPDNRLTRTASFSELPSARRIFIEQRYCGGKSPGLVRQYSCEQIFDQNFGTRQVKVLEVVQNDSGQQEKTWGSIVPQFNAFQVPDWQLYQDAIGKSKRKENEVEYMEIEDEKPEDHTTFTPNYTPLTTDAQTSKAQLFSHAPQDNIVNTAKKEDTFDSVDIKKQNTYADIKKKYRPLVLKNMPNTTTSSSSHSFCKILFFSLLPISVIIVSIILSQQEDTNDSVCNYKSVFHNAITELQEKVYGQQEALNALTSYLVEDPPSLKLACLIGGMGVGKSYTAEIIKKNFVSQHTIFEYFPPLPVNIESNILSASSCNLIILENLRDDNIWDVINLLKDLKHFKSLCITVLAVFSMKQIDDTTMYNTNLVQSVETMRMSFQNKGLEAKLIGYQSLDRDTLKLCILEVAKKEHLPLTMDQLNEIEDSLAEANSGCKRAYSKVQIVSRE